MGWEGLRCVVCLVGGAELTMCSVEWDLCVVEVVGFCFLGGLGAVVLLGIGVVWGGVVYVVYLSEA